MNRGDWKKHRVPKSVVNGIGEPDDVLVVPVDGGKQDDEQGEELGNEVGEETSQRSWLVWSSAAWRDLLIVRWPWLWCQGR